MKEKHKWFLTNIWNNEIVNEVFHICKIINLRKEMGDTLLKNLE